MEQKARERTVSRLKNGELDIVVATVGGGNGFKPMLMLDAQTFRDQFDRNVVSAFLAIRYGAPLMQPGGSIVCISSTAAKLPFNGLAAYHTAKGGLENLVRAAAEELGDAGIRVNAVRPGLTASKRVSYLFTDEKIFGKFLNEFPIRRAGQPVAIHTDFYGHDVEYHGRVVGIAAGSGSAFALLPPQNASGNWIKIVQRVPVRIALDPKELEAHPLRIGLSVEASVDISDTSGSAIGSVSLAHEVRGDAGDDGGAATDALIKRILAENGA